MVLAAPGPLLIPPRSSKRAAITIAECEESSAGRAKHIDVRFKKNAESVHDGTVRLRCIPIDCTHADGMIKPLSEIKFKRVRNMCQMPRTSHRGKVDRAGDSVLKIILDSVDQKI